MAEFSTILWPRGRGALAATDHRDLLRRPAATLRDVARDAEMLCVFVCVDMCGPSKTRRREGSGTFSSVADCGSVFLRNLRPPSKT